VFPAGSQVSVTHENLWLTGGNVCRNFT
jgi:hypothetical protein